MALDFLAGSVGGACGIAVGYPFDTVKVLMQTQTNENGPYLKYRNTFQAIRLVVREEGGHRLYRGLSTPLATVAMTNALTFGVYGHLMRQAKNKDSMVTIAQCGAGAGTARAFLISPIEVVKVQLQVPRDTPIGVFSCAKKVFQQAGLWGFTKGFGTCLLREPTAFCCYFTSFEYFTRGRKEQTGYVFLVGGMSGILSWVTTYPVDVIKSRLQGDSFGSDAKYRGTMHCVRKSILQDGWGVFYRGFGSTTYRAFTVNATVLGVYNLVMRTFASQTEVS